MIRVDVVNPALARNVHRRFVQKAARLFLRLRVAYAEPHTYGAALARAKKELAAEHVPQALADQHQ